MFSMFSQNNGDLALKSPVIMDTAGFSYLCTHKYVPKNVYISHIPYLTSVDGNKKEQFISYLF